MKLFGIAGWSGSGKTTLVTALLPIFTTTGFRVSTVKHAHHGFDVDQPGKDSYEHRKAGATEVIVTSSKRWVLMHENRNEAEPPLDELVAQLKPVDIVLIEGFKREPIDKLEVHRPELGKPLLQSNDPHIVGVASNAHLQDLPIPLLSLDDVVGIATFITTQCGLASESVSFP
jgi:molybdopterin-guanine dinucleotide biosynthesis protein B